MPDYLFDNRAPEAQQRFGGLEAVYDPVTIRHLEPYVVAGSRCLEVGGGGGSIASWMSLDDGDVSGRLKSSEPCVVVALADRERPFAPGGSATG